MATEFDSDRSGNREERLFRATVESAPTAIVITDHAGRIVLVNSETENLFKYSRNEMLGQPVELLVPERFRAQHPGLRGGFFHSPETRRMGAGRDLFALRKDGSEFPVEIGLNPIHTADGLFVLSAIVDITQRKQAERELRTLNETLEQRIAERTAQLEARAAELSRINAELESARQVADAASRAKSAFLATMSHEIRTPLNAVIGMTGLVLETKLSAEQREYLTMVRESGESLLHIINDILDFSKIEAERMDLEMIVFDHRELLGDTMKALGLRAHAKGIELLYRVAPDVPDDLVGDPARLRQVIVNLVGNAIKFTERGEVMLNVQCDPRHRSEACQIQLQYSVHDTGIGIPSERLAGIFEPFEQADTTTTRRFGGTGLGLAICSRLVELMGGRIWVESIEGRGTTFTFTARLAAAPGADGARRGAVNAGLKLAHLHGLPVLVIDDNPTNRLILSEMFRTWLMAPQQAATPTEALARLHEAQAAGTPFQLVLIDGYMPEMNGFELAARIAASQQLSDTAIMMLSSGDRPGDIARCEMLRVAAYLIKPIKGSELFDAILLALGITSVEEGATHEPASPSTLPALRILLAEDNPVNQKLACGLLRRLGHRVEVAEDGREVLEKARSSSFDVVLMDIMMPEMDGLDATKAIRAREQQTGHHLPIVALTAHALKGDRERCLEAGMDGYVSKPLQRQELLSEISRVLALPPTRGSEERRTLAAEDQPVAAALSVAATVQSPAPNLGPTVSDPVDWPVTWKNAHGCEETLREVVEIFLTQLPQLLGELQRGLQQSDTGLVERIAHTVKGQCRVFGARLANERAAQIETRARGGDLDVRELVTLLTRDLHQIAHRLREFLGPAAPADDSPPISTNEWASRRSD